MRQTLSPRQQLLLQLLILLTLFPSICCVAVDMQPDCYCPTALADFCCMLAAVHDVQ